MSTLGFEIDDHGLACAVSTSSSEAIAVNFAGGFRSLEMAAVITPAGFVVGQAALDALQVQPELPGSAQLLDALERSQTWRQDSSAQQLSADDLLRSLCTQAIGSAREIVFERHWPTVIAVESACRQQFKRWSSDFHPSSDWSVQAIVSRQTALAKFWSSRDTASQTVVTLDWAPRQLHIGVFTCAEGQFKLLNAKSISCLGLDALEHAVEQSLISSKNTSKSSTRKCAELSLAIRQLCQQTLGSSGGVGKVNCWIDGAWTELVLCRDHLWNVFEPMWQRALIELHSLLETIGLEAADVDRALLLGAPGELVRPALSEALGLDTQFIISLDRNSPIASGAALLSGLGPMQLQQIVSVDEAWQDAASSRADEHASHTSLVDREKCDIGLRIGNSARGKSMIYKLIEAGSKSPARRSRTFRTSRSNQNRLVFDLVYVDPRTGVIVDQSTRSLQLPPNLPAYTPIEVTVVRHGSGQAEILCPQISETRQKIG